MRVILEHRTTRGQICRFGEMASRGIGFWWNGCRHLT